MVSHITKTDQCEMPTPSLPAASLRRRSRFPARRVVLRAANYLIDLALWSIRVAILRAESKVLPALRKGGPPAERSVDRELPRDNAILEHAAPAFGEMAFLDKPIERAADRL